MSLKDDKYPKTLTEAVKLISNRRKDRAYLQNKTETTAKAAIKTKKLSKSKRTRPAGVVLCPNAIHLEKQMLVLQKHRAPSGQLQ